MSSFVMSMCQHLRYDVGLEEELSLGHNIVYYYNGTRRYEQFLQVG